MSKGKKITPAEQFRVDVLSALAKLSNEIATLQYILIETGVVTKAQLKRLQKDSQKNVDLIQSKLAETIAPLQDVQ